MKKLLFASAGLVIALASGPGAFISASGQQPRPPDNRVPNFTSDTQQLGYEHGYRDGADRGRQDRDAGRGRTTAPNSYLDSARYSYQPSFGNRRDYMSGYQTGFQAGYDDGFNYYNRPGQYGQIYGRQPSANRGGSTVQRPPFDSGYSAGVAAGQQDMQRNTRSDYRQSDSYRRGDPNFKDGFDRGYQDGYGRSRYAQDGGGYFPNRGSSGPADTRDGVGPNTRTITLPATQQWVSTGVRVNQGDPLRFQSTGEIQIGGGNRASVNGSLSGTHLPGSPLPNVLAGALIGRIDSGVPWGLGAQPMVAAPASGILYLGINDDSLNNNSGQFTVVFSW